MNRFPILIFCIPLIFVAVGCGGRSEKETALAAVNKTNMDRVINLYLRYQMQNRWDGPADEQAFREYIGQLSKTVLEPMGVDPNAMDELFTSERDGQAFEIRYGVQGNSRGTHEAIVFESVGIAGKRMVGFTSSTHTEIVDETEYDGLLSGSLKHDQPSERKF